MFFVGEKANQNRTFWLGRRYSQTYCVDRQPFFLKKLHIAPKNNFKNFFTGFNTSQRCTNFIADSQGRQIGVIAHFKNYVDYNLFFFVKDFIVKIN